MFYIFNENVVQLSAVAPGIQCFLFYYYSLDPGEGSIATRDLGQESKGVTSTNGSQKATSKGTGEGQPEEGEEIRARHQKGSGRFEEYECRLN